MCSIVYNLGRSHGRTALQVVDTQSLTASCDVLGLYVVLSQSCYCALTDLVVRNCGNELSVMTVVSQRYCYVSFTAAVVYIELVCLDKFLVVGVDSLSMISPMVITFAILVYSFLTYN